MQSSFATPQDPSSVSRRLLGVDADENEAAFFVHSSGFLKMMSDILPTKAKVPSHVTALRQRVDEFLGTIQCVQEAVSSAAAQQRTPAATQQDDNVGGGDDTSESAAAKVEVSDSSFVDIKPPARAAAHLNQQRHQFLSDLLQFIEKELLVAALPSLADTTKLRKVSRDLLQLVVLRTLSILHHRLPLLVELSLTHGFFELARQSGCSPSSLLTAAAEAQEEMRRVRSDGHVNDAADPALVSSASQDATAGESPARRRSVSPLLAQSFADATDHKSLYEILLTGVLAAERCLLRSLELLSQCCPPSSLSSVEEAASVRVVSRACADVVRGVKNLQTLVTQRIAKTVNYFVTPEGTLSSAVCSADAGGGFVVANEDELGKLVSDTLGIDACRLLSSFGFEVCRTACGYLIQVASISGSSESLPAHTARNKADATASLFRLMDLVAPDIHGATAAGSGKEPEAGDSLRRQSVDERTDPQRVPSGGCLAPVDRQSTDRRRSARRCVTQKIMPITLFADFVAAVGRQSGDENEGQLLCVKILQDSILHLCGAATQTGPSSEASDTPAFAASATSSPAATEQLATLLKSSKHRRCLFNGLLNVLVSVHKSVLRAGLEMLEALLLQPASLMYAVQEIGFLYSNALLRLLESENSHLEVKAQIVSHFRGALLNGRITLPGGDSAPLLLVLYHMFDLNRRLHQLHVVQQFVAALARIVRTSPPQEFLTPHASAQESLGLSSLHALAGISQLLQDVLPHEQIPLDSLRNISLMREEKVEDQRTLDLINNTPAKGICRRFFVDKATLEQLAAPDTSADISSTKGEEGSTPLSPAPTSGASAAEGPSLEYDAVPPPPNDEVKSKAKAIADFLLHTPALNPMSIGEFLSEPKYFPLQVCKEFMASLDLRGRSITGALSEMLSVLQLPKEGQRIERLLEFFTHAYYNANAPTTLSAAALTPSTTQLPTNLCSPSTDVPPETDSGASPRFEDRIIVQPPTSQHFPFANVDACFIVVVATVMLNTDLHNPRVSSKMTRDAFRSQLRGCNDNKDFPPGFAEGIFDSIHKRPLSNVKGIGAGTVANNTHVSTALAPAGTMDMLFFSASERKDLMFGMERQRLVLETREQLSRRGAVETPLEELAAPSPQKEPQATLVLALARDLFLCLWPSLCVVFSVAVSPQVTGSAAVSARGAALPPDMSLVRLCVCSGLESMLLTATAFNLLPEAEVTLTTLQKVCQAAAHRSVVDLCWKAILHVAATEHAALLAPVSWASVMHILVETKKNPPIAAALQADIEKVFGLLEVFVTRSAPPLAPRNAEDNMPHQTRSLYACAVRHALSALSESALLARGDGIALGAHLYIMRRVLVFAVLVSTPQGVKVESRIAMDLFLSVFDRNHWDAMLAAHGESNECLQLLHEAYAELASEIWCTMGPLLQSMEASDAAETEKVALSESLFYNCFIVLTSAMSRRELPPKTLAAIRLQVLQAAKTVLSSTISATTSASHDPKSLVPLGVAVRTWATLLAPLTLALSDPDMVASESCALAVLALRHIVVMWCGNTANAQQLPSAYRDGLGQLLAHVAYIGGMCADVNNAHSCVAQLTTLATTTLNAPDIQEVQQPLCQNVQEDAALGGQGISSPEVLHERLLANIVMVSQSPTGSSGTQIAVSAVAMSVVERACLLLRSDKQSVRQEAVDILKYIPSMLGSNEAGLCHFFQHVCSAVLEAALGHPESAYQTPLWHPCLVSFSLFRLSVPATLKRCSRTAFTSTLPLVLHAVSNDMLAQLPGTQAIAQTLYWAESCLTPLVVSPRTSSHTMRILALRALVQALQVAMDKATKFTKSRAEVDEVLTGVCRLAGSRIRSVASFVLGCLTLLCFESTKDQLQHHQRDVAAQFSYVQAKLASADRYRAQCRQALMELERYDGASIAGITPTSSLSRPHPAVALSATCSTDDRVFLQSLWSTLPLLVAPLPKIIQGTLALSEDMDQVLRHSADSHTSRAWLIPSDENQSMPTLLVAAVNHALCLHSLFLHAVASGADRDMRSPQMLTILSLIGPTGNSTSSGTTAHVEAVMHPHAIVRGALSSLLLLEIHSGCADFQRHVEELLLCVEESLGAALQLHPRDSATGASGGVIRPGHATATLSVSTEVLHLAKTCGSGMVQELSNVVQFLVAHLAAISDHAMTERSAAGTSALRALLHESVFRRMVALLSQNTLAANLIPSIKKYLVVYHAVEIAKAGRSTEPQQAECRVAPPCGSPELLSAAAAPVSGSFDPDDDIACSESTIYVEDRNGVRRRSLNRDADLRDEEGDDVDLSNASEEEVV